MIIKRFLKFAGFDYEFMSSPLSPNSKVIPFNSYHREIDSFNPNIDMYENEKETIVFAELPGFKPEDINLEFNGNCMQISGNHAHGEQFKRDQARVFERPFGRFCSSIKLRNGSDFNNSNIKLNKGVLEVHIPMKSDTRSLCI